MKYNPVGSKRTNKTPSQLKPSNLAGKDITLDIESLASTGEGIGRIDNRVVFVPYTMPGDRVRVRVNKDKKSYLQSTLTEIITAAPERTAAKCPHFTRCGGCDWLHIPYPVQCSEKTLQVQDTLQRIGGFSDVCVQPIVTAPHPLHYRNRIQGQVQQGKFHLTRRASNELIGVDNCLIAEAQINDAIHTRLAALKAGKYELAVGADKQVEILPHLKGLGTELGFRQVNSAVSTLLTEQLMHTIEHSPYQNILDLYCGRGDWSNQIASNYPTRTITGVDSLQANINAAQAAAKQKNLTNVNYHCATVDNALPTLQIHNGLCIVDPPRTGLGTTVSQLLAKRKPAEILYVSCHVATLARDLKFLCAAGYQISLVQPFDMFPQTAHVECLVQLKVS